MTVSKKKTAGSGKRAASKSSPTGKPHPASAAKEGKTSAPGRARPKEAAKPAGGAAGKRPAPPKPAATRVAWEATELEMELRGSREQIRGLLEERDNQAALLEAAESEREIIEGQLAESRERIEQLERRIETARSPRGEEAPAAGRSELVDIEYVDEEEEEADETSTEGDEVDEIYDRMDDPRVRRQELDHERLDREGEAGDEAFWLVCPKCGDSLEEIETEDVKLERCDGCGGIYLDRGEIEMLLSLGKGPRGLHRIRNVLQI